MTLLLPLIPRHATYAFTVVQHTHSVLSPTQRTAPSFLPSSDLQLPSILSISHLQADELRTTTTIARSQSQRCHVLTVHSRACHSNLTRLQSDSISYSTIRCRPAHSSRTNTLIHSILYLPLDYLQRWHSTLLDCLLSK